MPKENFQKLIYEAVVKDLIDCTRAYFDEQIALNKRVMQEHGDFDGTYSAGIKREQAMATIADMVLKLAVEVSRDTKGFTRARRTHAHYELLFALRRWKH